MITLKKIDVYGQLILIIASFIYAFVQNNATSVYCYYIVGGWQLISFSIHAILRKKVITVVCRNFYSFSLILSVASFLFCVAFHLYEQTMLLLIAFLFLAPLMAVYYLLISFRELSIWQHRQFIQLR